MTSRRLLDPVSKTLLDAADYMERHGHCKFEAFRSDGAVCVRGAIVVARNGGVPAKLLSDAWDGLASQADRRLTQYLEVPYAPDWNNAPERTAEEAIAALRGAALMAVTSTERQSS